MTVWAMRVHRSGHRGPVARGFSLVELVVVVVVLAILASVAVVSYRAVIDETHDEVAKGELVSLQRSLWALSVLDNTDGLYRADAVAAISAAGDAPGMTFTNGPSGAHGSVSWAYADGRRELELAMLSRSGRCVSLSAYGEDTDTDVFGVIEAGDCAAGGNAGPGDAVVGASHAYVWPGSQYLIDLLDGSRPVPEYVVLNVCNGDAVSVCWPNPDLALLDATADALRTRTAPSGRPVKVLGYVWTSVYGQQSSRPLADIQTSVDQWLNTRGGSHHYDGIFFDLAPVQCGTAGSPMLYRDKFVMLRNYVEAKLGGDAFIVNHSGAPVHQCFLEPGNRTADAYGTFEGSFAAYMASAGSPAPDGMFWVGGNVTTGTEYLSGEQVVFDVAGTPVTELFGPSTFWHVVYDAPVGTETDALTVGAVRYAGIMAVTDDVMPNPFDSTPTRLTATLEYAHGMNR